MAKPIKKKSPKIVEKNLPAVDWYDDLPAAYKMHTSQQALALMQREGITGKDVEEKVARGRLILDHTEEAFYIMRSQQRDLLCQLLLEMRETNTLLRKILKEAQA